MRCWLNLVLVLVLYLPLDLQAQRGSGTRGTTGAQIQVRVVLENNRPVESILRVQLTTGIGSLVSEGFTDSSGQVRFSSIAPGSYRIKVKGVGYEDAESDVFQILDLDLMSFQYVRVKPLPDKAGTQAGISPPISAFAMNVPDKAREQFLKGMELLTKATEIYPHYAEAFDWMGVAGLPAARDEAKDYFLKAIAADDHYLPTYTHLSRLLLEEKSFEDAEKYLTKSLSLDPRSAENLFLLSYLELLQDRREKCIEHALRADQLPHEKFAMLHMVAAEAYARNGAKAEAVAQFETFLKESPTAEQAAEARRAIAALSEPKN